MIETDNNNMITTEEAHRLLLKEREQRGKACGDEINNILQKYNCKLDWVETYRNGQLIDARWQIVPGAIGVPERND